jgi:Myb-like DNA-binding domain
LDLHPSQSKLLLTQPITVEEDVEMDKKALALALGQNRTPREAKQWVAKKLKPLMDASQGKLSKSVQSGNPDRRNSRPIFIDDKENEDFQQPPSKKVKKIKSQREIIDLESQTTDEFAPSRRKSAKPRLSDLKEDPKFDAEAVAFFRASLGGETSSKSSRRYADEDEDIYGAPPPGKKTQTRERAGPSNAKQRSIFDAQPDAKRLSFDSPTPRNGTSQNLQKRKREVISSDDESGDDQFKPPPPVVHRNDQAPRVPRETPRVPRESPRASLGEQFDLDILNEVHGPRRERSASVAILNTGVRQRKARGWAWTPEEEASFVSYIEKYGPTWSDIWHSYCQPGDPLHGRTQENLKDKARNLKLRYVRYSILI